MRLAEWGFREKGESVKVVPESLGYTSESAFSHAFKRVTRYSPKASRESAWSKSQPVAD
jgi:AraC-like DNA-binding protein